MPGEIDLSEADPFVVTKGTEETGGEFVQFEATVYPPPDADADPADLDLPHEPWGADNGEEHVHPKQAEWFEVLAGEFRVAYGDVERTLSEGEEVTLPRGVPHTHWNPTDAPARVRWERRPARQSEAWLETAYVLAQAGETGPDGTPGLLQTAVTFDEYPDDTYLTRLPVGLQKAAVTVLAPVGRLAGYEAHRSRDELDDDL
ncbi:MAG: cupin domain-containing protein [Haloarculaceae archaeon]